MVPENEDAPNSTSRNDVGNEFPLEARLGESPSADMDLMQFLVISGFTHCWDPFEDDRNASLRNQVREKYNARRSRLSRNTRLLETKTAGGLKSVYYRDELHLTTIRDLKDFIEGERRYLQGIPYFNVGCMTYFNTALRYFNIDEISFHVSPSQQKLVQSIRPYDPNP